MYCFYFLVLLSLHLICGVSFVFLDLSECMHAMDGVYGHSLSWEPQLPSPTASTLSANRLHTKLWIPDIATAADIIAEQQS